jgi:hypothetical protein
MQLAPQYWIHAARGFRRETAATYLSGFLENLLAVRSGEEPGVQPMDHVLARIEELTPGTADSPAKTSMVAIYALWHGVTALELHRPGAEKFLNRHSRHLTRPSMEAFSVGVLTGAMPDWSVEQWTALAERRGAERRREKKPSLPAKLDAALQAWAAARLIEADGRDEALSFVANAVEELPGDEQLIEWEARLAAGEDASLDVSRLLGDQRGDPTATQ